MRDKVTEAIQTIQRYAEISHEFTGELTDDDVYQALNAIEQALADKDAEIEQLKGQVAYEKQSNTENVAGWEHKYNTTISKPIIEKLKDIITVGCTEEDDTPWIMERITDLTIRGNTEPVSNDLQEARIQ